MGGSGGPQSAGAAATYMNTRGSGDLGYLGEKILTQVATAWMSLEVLGDLPDMQPAEVRCHQHFP